MPQQHIHLGASTPLSNLLIQFRQNLLDAREKASLLRGIMDNMNDAVSFASIEDEFAINPQYEMINTVQVRITDTRCNGYKVLAYLGDIDNLFKSNGGDGSQPQDKVAERIAKIINYLA